ncbi:hypothetical protein NY667_18565 [Xanthomonas hortorum pv. hederae]|uniref:Secreted protein n=1 Tax=Xanthomonas hortorum pv. hederae TaxID=453603 RepID=A0A9X4BUC4_9XANT|nr:hypothetical protein [Xanthomonas hortorum]MDC8639752.1 hypothetical protein [Xanthomonas hortorum pv. hederae]
MASMVCTPALVVGGASALVTSPCADVGDVGDVGDAGSMASADASTDNGERCFAVATSASDVVVFSSLAVAVDTLADALAVVAIAAEDV